MSIFGIISNSLIATLRDKNSNVIEVYNLISKKGAHSKQRTWYNSGIGTYPRPSDNILSSKIDSAIARQAQVSIFEPFSHPPYRDFERSVLGAYRWLSDNYEDGDCIFLFGVTEYFIYHQPVLNNLSGFSRGAYQVRVLSAMIDKVQFFVRCLAHPLTRKL